MSVTAFLLCAKLNSFLPLSWIVSVCGEAGKKKKTSLYDGDKGVLRATRNAIMYVYTVDNDDRVNERCSLYQTWTYALDWNNVHVTTH